MPFRDVYHAEILQRALDENAGSGSWRAWKETHTKRLIYELAARSPRLDVLRLDLRGDLLAELSIRMPVPRTPRDGRLVIGDRATFRLRYADAWRAEAPKGWLPISIRSPGDVYHSNVAPPGHAFHGAYCLGKLFPSHPLTELVIGAYSGLCLVGVVLDPRDPNGILNLEACLFFQAHRDEYVPLTRAGLFEAWEGPVNGGRHGPGRG